MVSKADFSSDEWRQLLESVMLSGMAVTAADPSGLWGTLKEGVANAGALRDAQADPSAGDLVKAIVADFGTSEGRGIARDGIREKFTGAKSGDIKSRSIEALRETTALLDRKAPEQSNAVRTWLHEIGRRVAEASKEGGFLGFGGVKVSDAEKATLDEIARALNI